jgi:hypothetical protein
VPCAVDAGLRGFPSAAITAPEDSLRTAYRVVAVVMDQSGTSPTGSLGAIGSTVTNGIQDISALLPLLGTEQCENHSGSALSEGYIYTAATPISIFGSLGIARGGFKAMMAAFSRGSQWLQNSGFAPSGSDLSLIMIEKQDSISDQQSKLTKRHLGETRLISKLEEMHIEDTRNLNIEYNCFAWNLKMLIVSALACTLAIIPYIYLVLHPKQDSKLPTPVKWILPSVRALGGFLTATMIPIVIQRRLVKILRYRLIFMSLEKKIAELHLKTTSFPKSINWDSAASSEGCVVKLRDYCKTVLVSRESIILIELCCLILS